MAIDYTANIGLANPDPGDCNWDSSWYRNQYISDICLRVLNSTNRVISGGTISLDGGFVVTVAAGSANVGGMIVSWSDTPITIDAAAPELEYISNWFTVDGTGTIASSTATPSGDSFIGLAVVDVDDTSILRVYDIRALQADISIIPAVENVLTGTGIIQAFLYDTSLDSDLGLWVEQTAWSSWYREDLATATRGDTRKFPKLALIVVETDSVTIYDAVNPSLPMWMVFNVSGAFLGWTPITSAKMMYGVMTRASNSGSNGEVFITNFREDNIKYIQNAGVREIVRGGNNISLRNTVGTGSNLLSSNSIVDNRCNKLAMMVLTGNDYPTIAVATDGGFSVIDGPGGADTVFSVIASNVGQVYFYGADKMAIETSRTALHFGDIPAIDYVSASSWRDYFLLDNTIPSFLGLGDNSATLNTIKNGFFGTEQGLTQLKEDATTPANSMVNFITPEYQSGWQQGDIGLATMADTTAETIGLDITTELVVNGDFSSALGAEWVAANDATIAIVADELEITNTVTNGYAYQVIPTVVGQTYTFSVDILAGTLTAYRVAIGSSVGGVNIFDTNSTAPDTIEASFIALSTSTYIRIGLNSGTAGTLLFDSVSIKANQNLVENGEFSSDRAWDKGDGWTISSGVAVCDGTQVANTSFFQDNVIETNKKYVLTLTVTLTAGEYRVVAGSIDYGFQTDTGTFSMVLDNDGGADRFNIQGDTDFTGTIDNISIYELDVSDRSVNNNPIQCMGQLEKTAVATGAELVSFSGFSLTDYLIQPYNADYQFGTGDLHMMAWIKTTDTWGIICSRQSSLLGLQTSSTFVRAKIGSSTYSGTLVVNEDSWHLVAFTRMSGVWAIYVDGKLDATGASLDDVDSTSSEPLYMGKDEDGNGVFSGEMTLVRIGATAPTAAQILEIYNSEKKIFAVDSEITLSETQVERLSYNSDSNTLKAGVTDGASSHFVDTFQDGIKINSEAVTTVPVSVDHTANSSAVAEATQVSYSKDAVDLKELG